MKYVFRNGKVVEADSQVSRPWVTGIISDIMEPLKHHGTGRVIDSKSKFRADTKASGCIETGTEQVRPRQPQKLDKRERKEAIRKAIYELRNR